MAIDVYLPPQVPASAIGQQTATVTYGGGCVWHATEAYGQLPPLYTPNPGDAVTFSDGSLTGCPSPPHYTLASTTNFLPT